MKKIDFKDSQKISLSILKYIDSAVSSNIANSLKKNTDLDERDSLLIGLSFPDLKSIVQKAAELYSGIINKSICKASGGILRYHLLININ